MSGGNGNVVGDISLKDSLNTGPVTSGGGDYGRRKQSKVKIVNINYGGTQKTSNSAKVSDPVSDFDPMETFNSPTQNTGAIVAVVAAIFVMVLVLKKKRSK